MIVQVCKVIVLNEMNKRIDTFKRIKDFIPPFMFKASKKGSSMLFYLD